MKVLPAVLVIAAAAVSTAFAGNSLRDEEPARVVANDNRTSAGTMRNGELHVSMVAQIARWYPEAEDGPFVDVPAFSEEGKPPQIPAPLLRVPVGTTIVATIRNAVPDSTLWVHGLFARPAATGDSVGIPPGETRTVRFAAGRPGNYLYRATPGVIKGEDFEQEQLAGAIVVDAVGGRTDDRIFVINIWSETQAKDSSYRNVLAVNGKAWPHTERISAVANDSLRWRVINASHREHPMHLHGFYFRVDQRGTYLADTLYRAEQRRLAVTEDLSGGQTMSLVWVPERPGNWLFHCHLSFHVSPEDAKLVPPAPTAHDAHASGGAEHMAGLVIGVNVDAQPGADEAPRGRARALRLFVNENPKRGRAPRALSFVLQQGTSAPARDSVVIPGTTLVLTRGEPTDITVVNRLTEPTAVHWHGLELESYSDGVAGWSGAGKRLAPVIAPGDSFTARLTLPRAGTFIYHTHLNDIGQITSGLYGALIVLEPGERFDSGTDHVYVAGWDGPDGNIVVNGDSTSPPLVIEKGETHRFRFVNIGPAARLHFSLRQDTTLVTWRMRAKDGADLPSHSAMMMPSTRRLNVGETADFEFSPSTAAAYNLWVRLGPKIVFQQRVIVR